jgi:Zn-dependent peptidase ImmA (M78 family)
MLLQKLLSSAELNPDTCATLLGINPGLFGEWLSGQSVIPESMVPMLSAVFSVTPERLSMSSKAARQLDDADVTPQIWFKFRGQGLIDADRELVLLIRQLGHYLNELEEVTRQKSIQWKSLFDSIRANVDLQAAPREQGRMAARIFRQSTSMGHGAKGSGEILRGMLRSLGVLVIETPLRESRIEGCSFYVGSATSPRPCAFANTYSANLFRRNIVLMHEVGHSIFDAFVGASIDFTSTEGNDAVETRAQAFALESLVPREVLHHTAQQHGIKWNALTAPALAQLVADTHVELRTILAAAAESGFVTPEVADELKRVDISSHLRQLSAHALSTEEYLDIIGSSSAEWIGKRTTTLPSRSIRLPIGYVKVILEAYQNRQISLGKASEFLMIDENDFRARFSSICDEVELESEAA